MKPHPRIRKTIKWGGAVATVLLVVVWIGSAWWYLTFVPDSGVRRILYGLCVGDAYRVELPLSGRFGTSGWTLGPTQGFRLNWWFNWAVGPPATQSMPLWTVVAMSLLPTAAAWRLDAVARARAGRILCPKCGYDLAGIGGGAGDAKCPECGTMPKGE